MTSVRLGDGPEDAALHRHHPQRCGVVGRVGRAGGVGENQALIAPVVGLAHRGVDTHVGGDAGQHQVRDLVGPEQQVEVGGVERALAGLVHDELAGDRGHLGHDLPARLAADEDPPARSVRADLGADLRRTPPLVCGQVAQVGRMTLTGVDDGHPRAPGVLEQPGGGRQPRPGEADVVPHLVDVAAGAAEVDLPVDADHRELPRVDRAVVGPRVRTGCDRSDRPSSGLAGPTGSG